jgi:hypothetical protein
MVARRRLRRSEGYNRSVILARKRAGDSFAIPLLLGVGITIALFAFLAWDLSHHWNPPRSRSRLLLQVLIAASWLVPAVAALRRQFRRRASASWPWVPARIEGGRVGAIQRGRREICILTATYAYTVEGETYGGSYTESFRNEIEAQELLESLKELPPPVRYKPSDASESMMEPYRDAVLDAAK